MWSLPPLLLLAAGARGEDVREIRGRVLDERGRPVAGVDVAAFWRANGTGKGRDGKSLDLKVPANVREFWSHLGEMEPVGSSPRTARTGDDGLFAVKLQESKHALMALDPERRRGGLLILPKRWDGEHLELRIAPLVKVRGSIRGPGAGEKPSWTHVYVNLPEDPARPLDSTRLVSCGSFEACFELSVPPGRYVLHGYREQMDARLVPDCLIDVAEGKSELDQGILILSDAVAHESVRIQRAKSSGNWIDVADRYGKSAPCWSITDVRGFSRGTRIVDFRGKWVLIYFWGFGCAPCLRTGLPTLARFYEEHAADRDRFEIVGLCIDGDGELKSMADLDRKLEPVVQNVWGGKALPYPVALDASYRTQESFGLSTLGPQLISPDGILLKGDEKVLAEKLGRDGRERRRIGGQ
jgi:thiol-disulfide isomerase/thioredoxin